MSLFDEVKKIPLDKIVLEFFPDIELKHEGVNLTGLCPLHQEKTPSFKIQVAKNCWKCFGNATCGGGSAVDLLVKAGLADKPLTAAKLIAERFGIEAGGLSGAKTRESVERLTVSELADWKKLPEKLLRDAGLHSGSKGVVIPYLTVSGELYAIRYRVNRSVEPRFRWASGARLSLYGLDRIATIKKAGWCVLVEGESDCWTAWHHNIPALGVPGKTTWRTEWAAELAGVSVYLWQEPAAEDFTFRVARDIADLRIIEAPEGIKDISEAHLQDQAVAPLIEDLKLTAILAEELLLNEAEANRAKLKREAGRFLGTVDPLLLIRQEIEASGYGGNLITPMIIYIAVTSRLLKMRRGSMPVHVQLLAAPSVGKSYVMTTIIALLPDDAWHRIDAGSPRVLIYDDADLKHKVLIFDEIDSLPEGDDNPAASALRNLLQEHNLKYSVVDRDPRGGGHVVKTVLKAGPTVLLTTGIRRTDPQLDSRLFCVEVGEDAAQITAALTTQATIEISGAKEPSEDAIAFQGYLQSLAPIDVVVPFDDQLVVHIAKTATSSRVLRDHARILSLIKSVTILRHVHRQRDKQGRLISKVADYAEVYNLIGATYAAASTGGSQAVRDAVQAVADLRSTAHSVTVSAVGKRLKVSKASASRRVNVGLENGWLVNKAAKTNGKAYDLDIGEPLPDDENGLPKPELLIDRFTDSPDSGWDMGGMTSDEITAIPPPNQSAHWEDVQ